MKQTTLPVSLSKGAETASLPNVAEEDRSKGLCYKAAPIHCVCYRPPVSHIITATPFQSSRAPARHGSETGVALYGKSKGTPGSKALRPLYSFWMFASCKPENKTLEAAAYLYLRLRAASDFFLRLTDGFS